MLDANAIKKIVSSMTLDDPDSNKKAVKDIISLGSAAVTQVCVHIEQEKERYKTVKLIEALGHIADSSSAEWIMNKTRNEKDEYLLSSWVKTAGRICGKESLPELKNLARASGDPRVLANLIELIGGSGDLTHIPFLKNLIYHQDNRVKGNALMAIIRLADSLRGETIQHIYHLAESSDETERMTVEYILRALNIRHPASLATSGAELIWKATSSSR